MLEGVGPTADFLIHNNNVNRANSAISLSPFFSLLKLECFFVYLFIWSAYFHVDRW